MHNEFSALKGISSLAQKLTETKRDRQYPLVYLLVKLTLILTVATASVEIVFSVMKIMKNPHLNKMGWMIVWLCTLRKMFLVLLIKMFWFYVSKIWEHTVDNYKWKYDRFLKVIFWPHYLKFLASPLHTMYSTSKGILDISHNQGISFGTGCHT